MAEKMLSLSELNRITGRSRVTLRAWCNSGKISHKVDAGRIFVPMSEMFRVFPDVTAADIETRLRPSKPEPVDTVQEAPAQGMDTSTKAELEELRATVAEQERLLTIQQARMESLQFKLEVLTGQVESLSNDKAFLIEQLRAKDAHLERMDRLIPEKSSAARREQPRGEHGRFTKKEPMKGEGVDGLLQGSLVG